MNRWALEGPLFSERTGLSPYPFSASPLSRASSYDPGRTRTCNPRLRRPMPYPLGHGALMSLLIMQHEKARDALGNGVRASEASAYVAAIGTRRCKCPLAKYRVLAHRSNTWPRGPMDKASAYGAGDCRFESCRGHWSNEGSGALHLCLRSRIRTVMLNI